ncbi:hypothetical protein DFJ73DRAFT_826633 [Zopfochytrium polystomum]|nr:hypothetical protein DFJ73DRAFT_826633 [Zopfochytrium polystomum]
MDNGRPFFGVGIRRREPGVKGVAVNWLRLWASLPALQMEGEPLGSDGSNGIRVSTSKTGWIQAKQERMSTTSVAAQQQSPVDPRSVPARAPTMTTSSKPAIATSLLLMAGVVVLAGASLYEEFLQRGDGDDGGAEPGDPPAPHVPFPKYVWSRLVDILTYKWSTLDIVINYALIAVTMALLLLSFYHPRGPHSQGAKRRRRQLLLLQETSTLLTASEQETEPLLRSSSSSSESPSQSANITTAATRASGQAGSPTPAVAYFLLASTVFLWAFQVILCFGVECYGVSIVWSAMWGMCAVGWGSYFYQSWASLSSNKASGSAASSSSVSASVAPQQQQHHDAAGYLAGWRWTACFVVVVSAAVVGAWVYYAVVDEFLTTVAHLLAFWLGRVLMAAGGHV